MDADPTNSDDRGGDRSDDRADDTASQFEVTLDLASFDAGLDPLTSSFGGLGGFDGADGALADALFDDISPEDPTNLHFGFGAG